MSLKQISQVTSNSLKKADTDTLRTISDGCFLAGFASIAASIAIWGLKKQDSDAGHAERFGIFVGLWAPTFFVLSNRFERYADRAEQVKAEA
jgi:hypothetical protein